MMSRSKKHFSLLVTASAMLLACGVSAFARQSPSQKQDAFAAHQRRDASENPRGVTFTLRLKGGQTRFRQGEVIRLELAFSSSLTGAYHLDSATYDRSGRLDVDDFQLDPAEGAADPLDEYFHSGLFGYMGGGLRGNPLLEAKPYVVEAELNEWHRFDRPGRYRLYVTSGRVSRKRHASGDDDPALAVTSNVVFFEVVPAESSWVKQTLADAVRVLDSADARVDRRGACRVLRFMGMEAAAREMARRFRGDESNSGCDSEYEFGLMSTPHRALAVAEMERRLDSPEHPVTTEFVRTLSLLSFLEAGFAPLAPYPDEDNEEAVRLWQKESRRHQDAYQATLNRYAGRLAAAALMKEDAARAVSLDTLLLLSENEQRTSKSEGEAKTGAESQAQASMKEALADVFTKLSVDTQESILESRWDEVSGPAMLPVLRRVYRNPPKGNDLLLGFALRRLYELSPDEGRRLVLEEMRRPVMRVPVRVLAMLPDETLPEADALIAERFGSAVTRDAAVDDERLLQLAERYASATVAPQLKMTYEARVGQMPCEPQSALLAYFLRVEPAYATSLIEKALASRKATGCYHFLLTEVAALRATPELESAALMSLEDSDAQLVANAAEMLGGYGSTRAREALLQRFARWHDEWAGREKELATQSETDPASAQTRAEMSLLSALSHAPAWLADEEFLKRLRGLCVTKGCVRESESNLKQFGTAITVFLNPRDGSVQSASLGQYNVLSWEWLKEKTEQFPSGTTFTFGSDFPGTEAEARVFKELKEHLEKAGMKLTR
jgi:uncharacterized protein (DUF1810 family)